MKSLNMGEQGDFRSLREWTPMTHLLQQIPLKAQRGLFTHQLNLTCVDCLPDYLVLGTNLGLVYWYDRRKDVLQRLRCENSSSAIVCVRVVSTLDYMIAAGSEDGNVTVFQIPRPSETIPHSLKSQQNRQIERFTVTGLHMGPVTALEWSPNGMNLFSGDKLGIIVLTEIDFYMHLSKSREVLNEKYEVVQLSYHSGTGIPQGKLLLVSTVYRTTLCSWRQEDRSWKVSQLGQRERKTLGQFGATFYHPSGIGATNHRDIVFASRPGLRLWQAGLDGIVQQTLIFKDALMCPHPSIMLVNPVPSRFKLPKLVNGKSKDRTPEKNEERPGVEAVYQHQLGYLNPFADGLILTYWKGASGSLLVLDPEDTGVVTSAKTGPGGLRSIISVAVTPVTVKPIQTLPFDDDSVEQGPEIFILEGGRSLIRIAYHPDYNYSKGSGEQEEGISSSVRSLFSNSIFPPSLPSPPPLLKDLTTSLLELTTGPGIGGSKAGVVSCGTPQKGENTASSSDPVNNSSPFNEERRSKDLRRSRNEGVVMADEALEIPPIVGMPFEMIPTLQTTVPDEAPCKKEMAERSAAAEEEDVSDSRQQMYEEVLYKPKKKEKRKKSAIRTPCHLEPGGPCSEGSSSRSTGSEEDSTQIAPECGQKASTANGKTVVDGPLHYSWPPPDDSKRNLAEKEKGLKTPHKLPLDKKEEVPRRRKSEVVAKVNLRSSVVEEGHVGGVEAWLPSMPLAPDLRSPTSIRQDVESKGELLAKLLDLKPILPQPQPQYHNLIEEKSDPSEELPFLPSERSFALNVVDGPDMDAKCEPPKLLLETSVTIGEAVKSEAGGFVRKSLPLETDDQRMKKTDSMEIMGLLKRGSVAAMRESGSSDSEWELL